MAACSSALSCYIPICKFWVSNAGVRHTQLHIVLVQPHPSVRHVDAEQRTGQLGIVGDVRTPACAWYHAGSHRMQCMLAPECISLPSCFDDLDRTQRCFCLPFSEAWPAKRSLWVPLQHGVCPCQKIWIPFGVFMRVDGATGAALQSDASAYLQVRCRPRHCCLSAC